MARKKNRKRKAAPQNRKLVSPKTHLPNWLKSEMSRWIIGFIVTILVSAFFYYLSTKDSKRTQLQLDNLFIEKHGEELKKKYPGGHMLLSIDSSKNKSKNEFIPSGNNFMEEYELDWSKFRITKITDNNVTLELPYIRYKPRNTIITANTQTIPRSPIGKSYPLKIDWRTNKYKLYMELVEDKETIFTFAIGFKPK